MFVRAETVRVHTHVRIREKGNRGGGGGRRRGKKEIREKQDEEINLYEVLINVNPT